MQLRKKRPAGLFFVAWNGKTTYNKEEKESEKDHFSTGRLWIITVQGIETEVAALWRRIGTAGIKKAQKKAADRESSGIPT